MGTNYTWLFFSAVFIGELTFNFKTGTSFRPQKDEKQNIRHWIYLVECPAFYLGDNTCECLFAVYFSAHQSANEKWFTP